LLLQTSGKRFPIIYELLEEHFAISNQLEHLFTDSLTYAVAKLARIKLNSFSLKIRNTRDKSSATAEMGDRARAKWAEK